MNDKNDSNNKDDFSNSIWKMLLQFSEDAMKILKALLFVSVGIGGLILFAQKLKKGLKNNYQLII